MKIHKQAVLIESYNGYLEVLSFFETDSQTYGVDVFYDGHLVETSNAMRNEPQREHLLSFGYSYIAQNLKDAG